MELQEKEEARSMFAPGGRTRSEVQEAANALRKRVQTVVPGATEREALLSDIATLMRVTLHWSGANAAESAAPHASGATAALSTSEVLLRILDMLAPPADLLTQSQTLRQEIESGNDAQLDRVVGKVSDLFRSIRTRLEAERKEYQVHIAQLVEFLSLMEATATEAGRRATESLESGRALDTSLRQQVEAIEHNTSKATDVNALRQLLNERFAQMRTHLDQHRVAEEARAEEAHRQLDEMREKVQSVERESAALRARLEQEQHRAFHDALTGVPNRLALNERLDQEYARFVRYRAPLSLIILDIDHFKKLNDAHGHRAGDRALTLVAKLLRDSLRETDFIARYGGEEFVALLPETAGENARVVAEKLRAAVERANFTHNGARVPVTLSAGFAMFREGDGIETVIERADAALYRAKHGGRNQCCAETG
jgi:diguanylate cyclase